MIEQQKHQKHTPLVKPSWEGSTPDINGLVLAGGKSSRMGEDKSMISYHGMPQRDYMLQLLHKIVPEVFLSCHPDRIPQIDYRVIPDTFLDLGPYGGVLSAFRQNPNRAWLTVACDQPLIDESFLNDLISQRDPEKVATCYHDSSTGFPEPMITIWEPRAYPVLLQFLSEGRSCLRKALINSDVLQVETDRPEVLKNANSPEEMMEMRKMLNA
jgi:molybdenum cofactor guanylyltransferase